jgi:hypothetical protein
MGWTVKTALWITGVLAAIALIFRGAVLIGLYLGILPGIILAVAPTLFLYTAVFAVLRTVVYARTSIRRSIALNAIAVALTVALGLATAAPVALAGRRAFAAAIEDEVTPAQSVRLAGDVLLECERNAWSLRGRPPKDACEALCAALLDTPGVRSVTIRYIDSSGAPVTSGTYRIVPKAQSAGATLMPADPSKIVEHLPDPDRGKRSGPGAIDQWLEARKALQASITAKWALRLGNTESLIEEPALTRFDVTIAIRDIAARGAHRIGVDELEIVGGNGDVLLRRQHVTASPVAMPLHLTPGGPMMDRGFEVGRRQLYTQSRYFEVKPVETLFERTTLARPVVDEKLVARLRENLAAPTPAAGSAENGTMVAPWLATLDWAHLSDKDVDVLAKLIADPRTTGLDRLYDGYARDVSPRLRRPIAIRLLEVSTSDRLRSTLNTLVRNMPPGTYAELLPEEQALLANQSLRLRSSALVARLSDQGAKAVPRLVDLLNEDIRVEPSWRSRSILDDIRRALSHLGRDAASALPEVERWLDMRHSPLTNTSNDAFAWRVAIVRMGKPVEALTFPSSMSAEIVARDRERIRQQAERGPER